MNRYITSRNGFAISLSAAIFLCVLRLFGMTFPQRILFSALILTIVWWVTGFVNRTVASLFLLAVFFLSRQAQLRTILTFPLSQNFLLIVFSFLFSEGIKNSGLADKFLKPLLQRFAGTIPRLLVSMFLSCFLMIFIIPQPFSRIIILSGIYNAYFEELPCVRQKKELKAVLMTGLFMITVLTNLMMIRGDIILNNALLSMGQVTLTEGQWLRYMLLPTLGLLMVFIAVYVIGFRGELAAYEGSVPEPTQRIALRDLTGGEKRNLAVILAIVLLWATESLHGISGLWLVIAGTIVMFPLHLLDRSSYKAVNIGLLVFLTAAFAIGGVLKAAGIADIIFSRFTVLFPAQFSALYCLIVTIVAMVLHMLLGSNVTTMSVVVPGIMSISAGVAPEIPVVLTLGVAICGHFLLPFHHVVLLLGEGSGYYRNSHLLRLGLPMTILTPLYAVTVYLAWWHLMGLL